MFAYRLVGYAGSQSSAICTEGLEILPLLASYRHHPIFVRRISGAGREPRRGEHRLMDFRRAGAGETPAKLEKDRSIFPPATLPP
jgi:hypothetical protein